MRILSKNRFNYEVVVALELKTQFQVIDHLKSTMFEITYTPMDLPDKSKGLKINFKNYNNYKEGIKMLKDF